jgi:hypothetical protein
MVRNTCMAHGTLSSIGRLAHTLTQASKVVAEQSKLAYCEIPFHCSMHVVIHYPMVLNISLIIHSQIASDSALLLLWRRQ